MGQEVQLNQKRAHYSAQRLCHQERNKFRKIPGFDRNTKGHRRVQSCVRAATCDRCEYARHNGKRPASGDRQPPRTLGLGFLQQHICEHAIAQQDEDRGPYKLTEAFCSHFSFFPVQRSIISPRAIGANSPMQDRCRAASLKFVYKHLNQPPGLDVVYEMKRSES